MLDFIPPFPVRPSEPLPPYRLLQAAYRNLLEIWEEKAFEYRFFSTRILMQTVHVCNSPAMSLIASGPAAPSPHGRGRPTGSSTGRSSG
jgi:hypothetical protein